MKRVEMSQHNRYIKVLPLMLFVMLLSGCSTSGIEAIGQPSAAGTEVKKHLLIHNDALAKKITISDMRSREVGGLLEVRLKLTNLTGSDKEVSYRFSWFDHDEFEVEAGTDGWTPVSLHGAQSVSVYGVAPNSSVKSYRLNVKGQ
ncbi:MAG: YcfL family protein [Gammaproteobacteria bacterium]|nr:YcfL family protein [Gammaproteobacteria bacterium]